MRFSPTAVVVAAVVSLTGLGAAVVTVADAVAPARASTSSTVPDGPWRPVDNDCSAGHVVFTFDDGPDLHTRATMRALQGLNLKGVFFVEGQKLAHDPEGRQTVRDLAAAGFGVENHTFDHRSITGETTGTTPMTAAELVRELQDTTAQIMGAGLPRPTLYRPPFGDVDAYADAVARRLGYRIVLSWGNPGAGIIDARDWSEATPAEITRIVTRGRHAHGSFYPPARDGSIIAMHDGQRDTSVQMLESLQPIVDWMNEKHLCSTDVVPSDATGGVVPPASEPAPRHGNLLRDESLEARRAGKTVRSEPDCFEQGGAETDGNDAWWYRVSDARTGGVAERVDIRSSRTGDRKLVVSQRPRDAGCLPKVTPGRVYRLWEHYKGTWTHAGTQMTRVSLDTYYRDARGTWRFWTSGPLLPPSRGWTVAQLDTPPVPAGATAISFGIGMQGLGSITVDDLVMTVR